MADLLQYWRPKIADWHLKMGGPLNHTAGEQIRRVKPGDTIWVVTAVEGHLTLLGRFLVDVVTDMNEAQRLLKDDDLWPASYHAIAAEGEAEELREVDLRRVCEKLRFVSNTGRDRLLLVDGAVRPQQLQVMRILTPESAVMLEREWGKGGGG
jgi:hypothetical protein